METFKFKKNETVTFFWNITGRELTGKQGQVTEIEDKGVWISFDGEEEKSFVTFSDMHLFFREGSTMPEGTQSLHQLNFDGADPETIQKLIESLTK